MTTTIALAPYRTITADAARRAGLEPRRVSVEALHARLPQDGSVAVVWECMGRVNGTLIYNTANVRATARGIEVLTPTREHLDRSNLNPRNVRVVMVYPLGKGREVRTLGRKR